MLRIIIPWLALVALALPIHAESPVAPTTVSGTVEVEKSLTGGIESVHVVGSDGEKTRVVGVARDAIAAQEGKQVAVVGVVTASGDGARTVVADDYATR